VVRESSSLRVCTGEAWSPGPCERAPDLPRSAAPGARRGHALHGPVPPADLRLPLRTARGTPHLSIRELERLPTALRAQAVSRVLAPAQGVELSECSGRAHGDVCSTRCGSGLVPRKGSTSRKCVSRLWTGIPLSCGAASCLNLQPPPGFAQPRVPYVDSQTEDVCEMVCGEERVATPMPLANRMRVCVDGSWMGRWTACPGALPCPVVPPGPRVRHLHCNEATCTFECAEGTARVAGNYTRDCLSGAWAGYPLECQAPPAQAGPRLSPPQHAQCVLGHDPGRRV
jgi:hypothetical protein